MNLFDVIPCGAEAGGEPRYEVKNENDMIARKRNFYAALSYIHTYPPYDDMESRIGVSSFIFSRQVLPALYNMSAHAYFMDMNVRFWDYNHTADFQERVLWSVDGYPMEVCASSNRFVRKLTKSGKYKTHVLKGDMVGDDRPWVPGQQQIWVRSQNTPLSRARSLLLALHTYTYTCFLPTLQVRGDKT